MAFSKTPSESTYQTKRIRLVKELSNRGSDTSTDEDYVNVFPEQIKNKNTKEDEIVLMKRDGSQSFIDPTSGDIRGIYWWAAGERLLIAASNDLYLYDATGTLIATASNIFGTLTGPVGFTDYLYDTGTVVVVVTDGTTLFTVNAAGTTNVCGDADLPVHIPYPVFLDGYLFIIKSGTSDIYNSNLNDPLLWTPGDFITAEMIPDRSNWLARINNYIVCGGLKSIEYFWNAANASGSPLQRNDTPIKLSGFLSAPSVLGNKIFFVGQQEHSMPDVFLMEDFKLNPVGNEAIRRHLASLTTNGIQDTTGATVSMRGHHFYVINTGSHCYVYEMESKLWSKWKYQGESNFDFSHWINMHSTAGYSTIFALGGSSRIYKTAYTLYRDDNVNFPCVIVTSSEKFSTMRQKVMNRLVVWADTPAAASNLLVQWTDDDYQSYNTGLNINLAQERPSINRLGRFRERAFKLTYTDNYPFRIEGLEVEVNMGQT